DEPDLTPRMTGKLKKNALRIGQSHRRRSHRHTARKLAVAHVLLATLEHAVTLHRTQSLQRESNGTQVVMPLIECVRRVAHRADTRQIETQANPRTSTTCIRPRQPVQTDIAARDIAFELGLLHAQVTQLIVEQHHRCLVGRLELADTTWSLP